MGNGCTQKCSHKKEKNESKAKHCFIYSEIIRKEGRAVFSALLRSEQSIHLQVDGQNACYIKSS